MREEELLKKATEVSEWCWDRAGEFEKEGPAAALARVREAGLLEMSLERALGGGGWEIEPGKMMPALDVLRILGRGFLSLGRIFEGHVNALRLIQDLGTEAQREKLAADVKAGHCFGIWNTGGADDVELGEAGDGFELKGAKLFASGAASVTRPIISARTPDGGSQLLVVKLDECGARVAEGGWEPMGMKASVSVRVDFSGVKVSEDDLLGEPDDYSRQPWLSGGAIRFLAVQVGGAEALVRVTRDHLRVVGREGNLFQQARVGEMETLVEGARLWLEGAARQSEFAAEEPEKFQHYVGLARGAVENACFEVGRLAQKSVGLQGFLGPHPMERVVRDLLTYLRQPNPDGALAGAGWYVLNSEKNPDELWKMEK